MQALLPLRRARRLASLLAAGSIAVGALAGLLPARQAWAQKSKGPITMALGSPLAQASIDSGTPSSDREQPMSVMTRFGRWFPIAVDLTNSGEGAQDTTVTLSMRLFSSSDPSATGSVSTFEAREDLPKDSKKRVWIYGRVERGECDAGEVTISGRGVSGFSRTFLLADPSDGARVVYTISDSDSGERLANLSSLSKLRATIDPSLSGYGQNYNNGRAVEALGSRHDLVPTRWFGLDGVDLVVLHDFAHTSLSTEQLDALRGYVASGGSMLVLGGSNTARLAASPLSAMWPVKPSASRVARSDEREAVVDLLKGDLYRANLLVKNGKQADLPSNLATGPRSMTGADRLGGAPLLVATGAVSTQARPLSSKLPLDIAAVQSYGAGRVEWLAFDPTRPPFVGWRGQEALWKPVVARLQRPRQIMGVDSAMETSSGGYNNSYNYYGQNNSAQSGALGGLRASLARSPQLRTPSASSIAWFLALYVFFLVPVNYVVLRAIDRRELAWVTVPLIVIAFSTLSYVAAVRIKGTQLRARHVSIVQGSDASPLARADSMLWVFSPRKAAYSISGGESATMASAVYADGRRSDVLDNSLLRQSAAGGVQVDGSPINMWDYKSFVGHSVVPTSNGFELRQRGSGRTLVNRTGHDLKSAAWIENGRTVTLSDLPANGTIAIPTPGRGASSGGSVQLGNAAGRVFSFDGVGTGQDIATSALQAAGVSEANRSGSVLVAWQVQPAASLAIEGEAPVRESVTLWVWRFTK